MSAIKTTCQMLIGTLLCAVIVTATSSCGKKQQLAKLEDPYGTETTDTTDLEKSGTGETAYQLPFTVNNGSYMVDVALNGVTVKFIWDTGCNLTTISSLEAQNLVKAGVLSPQDVAAYATFEMADGSHSQSPIYNIKKVRITCANGQYMELSDVEVSVSQNPSAPALLGTNIIEKLPHYSIDNQTGYIDFEAR